MLHVGCTDFPIAKAKYVRSFDFSEVTQTFFQLPRAGTLAKLREGTPKGFTFALRASQLVTHDSSSPGYARLTPKPPAQALARLGLLKDTAEVKDAWKKTLAAARAVDARFIVVEAPAALGTSQPNRDTLKRFFSSAPRDGRSLVWEPRGLWEPGQARRFAKELGVILVEDPLADAVEGPTAIEGTGGTAFVRLRGMGGRISPSKLELVVAALGAVKDAFVVVETRDAVKDAQRLLELAQEMAKDEDDEDEDASKGDDDASKGDDDASEDDEDDEDDDEA